jgi:nicotinamidase/pyrazinamidase
MAGSQAKIGLRQGDALIVVDVQNDFLPGGALAVPGGDEVVPVLNRYLACFEARDLAVFASRDWHPPDHCSFQARGGIWPSHCVAGTQGAEFAPGLELPEEAVIVEKAATSDRDAYSAFEDTGLGERLRRDGLDRLFIGGLATDYCVLNTVRDAAALRYELFVLHDAIRAVDLQVGDGAAAVAEMQGLGARLIALDDIADGA